MRRVVFAPCLLILSLAQLVIADDTSAALGDSHLPWIEIETRLVTISPDFIKVGRYFGNENNGIVPPSPMVESRFSPAALNTEDSEEIKLISASSVVEERNPIHVETVSLEKMVEFVRLSQQDSRTLIMFAPEAKARDQETAEIIATSKRPFVVDIQNDEPIVREYEEGTTLLVRPCLKQSGSIQLDLHARVSHIEDVSLHQKDETRQIQSLRTKTCKIELSATLKPRETLVIWGDDLNTPEVTAPVNGVARIIRKKPAVKRPKSSLVLLITPKILTEEVASIQRE